MTLLLVHLPHRWYRWNRYVALIEEDGQSGPVGLGRTADKARQQALFLHRHGLTLDTADDPFVGRMADAAK